MAREKGDLPPGPRLPAVIQLVWYTLRTTQFLDWCQRRFGDPVTIHLAGYGKFVLLSSPEAIKDVFRGDGKSLHSGEGNAFLSMSVGRSSVLVLDEERHARQRRILIPPLKGERMRSFLGDIQRAAREESSRWPVGRPFPVHPSMRTITMNVILRIVLGDESEADRQEASKVLN